MKYVYFFCLVIALLTACGSTPTAEPTTTTASEAATNPPASPPISPPTSQPTDIPPAQPTDVAPTDTAQPAPPTDIPATDVPPTETPIPEPTVTFVPIFVSSFPQGDTVGDELQFQTIANDPSAGPNNGDGIDNVYFRIVDSQDTTVHERTEQNPLYCTFGGGDDLQNCDIWRFSENNNSWPGGIPVENGGTYRLQVTIYAQSGQVTYDELLFTVQLP
jgi:hypothetical protein